MWKKNTPRKNKIKEPNQEGVVKEPHQERCGRIHTTKNKIKPYHKGAEKNHTRDGVVEKYEKISKNKTYKK